MTCRSNSRSTKAIGGRRSSSFIDESPAGFVSANSREPEIGNWIAARESSLLRLIRKQMGKRTLTWIEPEDLLQECVLVVLRHLDRFHSLGEAERERWFFAISRNLIRNASRRAARGNLESLDNCGESGLAEDLEYCRTKTNAVARSQLEQLMRHIWALPLEARMIIIARNVSNLTWTNIAALLGKQSANAARKFHMRAHSRLGSLLRARKLKPHVVQNPSSLTQ